MLRGLYKLTMEALMTSMNRTAQLSTTSGETSDLCIRKPNRRHKSQEMLKDMHVQEACEELMSEAPWRSTAALRSIGWCPHCTGKALAQGERCSIGRGFLTQESHPPACVLQAGSMEA